LCLKFTELKNIQLFRSKAQLIQGLIKLFGGFVV